MAAFCLGRAAGAAFSSRLALGSSLGAKAIRPAVATSIALRPLDGRRSVEQAAFANSAAAKEKSTDHRTLWKTERAVAVGLLAAFPVAYFYPSPAVEFVLTTAVVLHAHWGLAGVFADYVHGYPSASGDRRYPWLQPSGQMLLYALSIAAFAGLLHFNYNDVGLLKAISMVWKL